MTGAIQGTGLDPFGQAEQGHDHGRFRPLGQQHGAGHGNAHQRVDVQLAIAQGNPTFFIDLHPAGHNGCQRQQNDQPLGRGQPMADLRPQGQGHGSGNARQSLAGGCGSHGRLVRHARLKAQSAQGLQNRIARAVGVIHCQHTLHQVKTQALHLRHPLQAGADHVFFRRAVHVGNMHDQSSRRTGGQCRRRRHGGRSAAGSRFAPQGVIMLLFMTVRMAMIMVMRVIVRLTFRRHAAQRGQRSGLVVGRHCSSSFSCIPPVESLK